MDAKGIMNSETSLTPFNYIPKHVTLIDKGHVKGGAVDHREAENSPSSNKPKTQDVIKSESDESSVTIGNFAFLRGLSKGAFASVYLGRHTRDGNVVAIKALNKAHIRELNMQSQILSECKLMRYLSKHVDKYDHMIVSLYSTFQTNSYLYLVMEYLPGGDLMNMISMLGSFPERVARFFIAEVCLAVHHLHLHSIVHRDIKPDNVLLTCTGHVKV